MIMISKRQFRPGMGPGTVPLFQHVTDMIYPVAAGCIAAYDFPAQEKADYAWSLRIFSSYTKGTAPRASISRHAATRRDAALHAARRALLRRPTDVACFSYVGVGRLPAAHLRQHPHRYMTVT